MPRKGTKRKGDGTGLPKTVKRAKKGKPKLPLVETECEPSRVIRAQRVTDLKICCFNVNGIRASAKKGLTDYIAEEDADFVCMSEMKCALTDCPATITAKFEELGYTVFWGESEDKGRYGSCILSKHEPISCTHGIGASDEHGRAITLEFEKYYLVNCYVANSGRKLKFEQRRKTWDAKMKEHLQQLREKKQVIWTGDLNVAIEDFDVYDGETNKQRKKTAGFTPYERDNFRDILTSMDLVDVYREFYPTKKNTFTFWSYLGGNRAKNCGWRLDYFITTREILELVNNIEIRRDNIMSDHAPLILTLRNPNTELPDPVVSA